MKSFGRRFKYYAFIIFLFAAFNGYFLFLSPGVEKAYLYYVDLLLGVCLAAFFLSDCGGFYQRSRKKKELLQYDSLIYLELEDWEDKDIIIHDVETLSRQLQEKFEENCELQDYVAKWCHEIKIPLSEAFLLNENSKEADARNNMREQLERMNQNLHALLLSCKLQSPLFDLQIREVSLQECIYTSIQNNQFFLIRKKFELITEEDDYRVYTDPAWLVYVLDQLISNAVKYAGETPKLHIRVEGEQRIVRLFVEDFGEGIRSSDITRIFEKGYTGQNYHNGKYKSTGMGLYMADKIIKRLGHEIAVESQYGAYTRFCISFLT